MESRPSLTLQKLFPIWHLLMPPDNLLHFFLQEAIEII